MTAPDQELSATAYELIIVGAGGHAREVAWVAREATQPWNVRGLLDDRPELAGCTVGGEPVLGTIDDWIRYPQARFVVAIGDPRVRRTVVDRMRRQGQPTFAVLVHRSVVHSPSVSLAEGTMVMAGCVLSTDIEVGRHVILNQSTTVAHDCRIDDFCTLAPRVALSGNVSLGESVEVGTGACVRQGLRIDQGALVGMGSVVTRAIPTAEVWFGNPARLQRTTTAF
jgi:sugar O-acyltransferase (sialic acid O-acetyltransferase NeuD family)